MESGTRIIRGRHAGGASVTGRPLSAWTNAALLRVGLPLLIIGVAVVGAQVLILNRPPVPKADRTLKPTLVEVTTARTRDERAVVTAYGTVQAHRQLIVHPEVGGRVVRLNPKLVIGGILEKDEALLRIDPRDYQFAVDEERASLAEAEFDLKVELGNQAVAKREWNLLKPSSGEVSALSQQLALRRPHLKEKYVAFQAAKSRFQKARLDLQRTVVRTPFHALVLQESVEKGQLVNAQRSVATLVDVDEFRVQVSVPIPQLAWITFPGSGRSHGARVRVIREIGSDEPVVRRGTVVELLGDVTENGRMAQVLVAVQDPLELEKPDDGRRPLLLGEYVRVEIEGPVLRGVIVLPRPAIREGSRVWVKNAENHLDVRQVDVALSRRETVLISRGLRDGEQVITSQLTAAIPGLLLRTVDDATPPAGSPPKSGKPDDPAAP